jgi:fatty acid desaturase
MVCPKKPMIPYRGKIAVIPTWFQPLLYFVVVMQGQWDDFLSYWRGYQENTKINDQGFWRTTEFYGTKLTFFSWKLFIPVILGYRGWFSGLYLFIVTEAIAGYLFGYFTQITHINEEVEWPSDKPINEDWGTLQVRTAVDYCQDSFFWTYASGYLNYQIAHHLFPSVAPHFYPALLPIIKETCKEFGVKYVSYDSVWECSALHFNHMKSFQKFRYRYYDRVKKDPTKKSTLPIDRLDDALQFLFKGVQFMLGMSPAAESDVSSNSSNDSNPTPIVNSDVDVSKLQQ